MAPLEESDRRAALAALGLDADATARDIISAYRRLARLHHPDAAGSTSAGPSDFATISDAYHLLTRGVPPVPSADQPTVYPPPAPAASEAAPQQEQTWAAPLDGAFAGDSADDLPLVAGPVIIRPLPPEPR